MKATKTLSMLAAAVTLSSLSIASQAATYSLVGQITACTGICSIFTTVGQAANFGFAAPDGMSPIAAGSISNVSISLSTPSGGALAFVNGTALASTLTASGGNLTGGTVTLQATGATTGIVARGMIDIAAMTWTAVVVGTDGSLTPVAAGTITGGTVSAVPVPAAAWLFGSALVGLSTVARRRRI